MDRFAQGVGNSSGKDSLNTEIKITPNDLGLDGAKPSIGGAEISAVFGLIYFVAGIVAVIVIIIGGIRYVTSNGDSSGIQAAKNTVLYAVVGLVVVIAAAAITDFVINNVAK